MPCNYQDRGSLAGMTAGTSVRGPHNAAVKGWKYHLVIKGFNCPNRESSIRLAVATFLDRLFASDSVCPLEYCYHHADEDRNNLDNHILKVRVISLEFTLSRSYHPVESS